jgi:hypothetical protein
MPIRTKHPTQRFRRRKQFNFNGCVVCFIRSENGKSSKALEQFEEFKYMLVMFRDGGVYCTVRSQSLNIIQVD